MAQRREELLKVGATTQDEVDQVHAQREVAEAQSARLRALIAKKTIRAPFRARVGLSDVHPGQYLSEGVALTTLAHHIDCEWLYEAYRRTRKDGAAGVDGQTAAEYAVDLEENLRSLLDRAKSGDHYRAPPVRRVHIPKGDGKKTRPIGIPAFEDKVLQRAVAMALEAVYEQDFLECSYGFRPGRSAHQALQAVWSDATGAVAVGDGWIVHRTACGSLHCQVD